MRSDHWAFVVSLRGMVIAHSTSNRDPMNTRSTRTRFAISIIVLCALACLAYFGAQALRLKTTLAAEVQPYVIIWEEVGYLTDADGRIKDTNPLWRAGYGKVRHSDGSAARITFNREAWGNGREEFEMRDILRVDMASRVTIFDLTKVQSLFRLTPREVAAAKENPGDPTCMTHPHLVGDEYTNIGRDTMLGFEVVKHRRDPPGSSGLLEVWEAPELACEALYQRMTFRGPNGLFETATVRTAVRADRTEPSAGYFKLSAPAR